MEIEYRGGNCVVINTKKSTIVIDPKIQAQNDKEITVKAGVQLATQAVLGVPNQGGLYIESPGEYEVANASIKGIAAKSHLENGNVRNATIYSLDIEGVRLGIMGHVSADLSDEQLEELGTIDVMVVPVGGYGYTLEPHEAVNLVKRIGPKVVIPTHYADETTEYAIAQGELDTFTKELGAPTESVGKYKIKNAVLPDILTVVIIGRS